MRTSGHTISASLVLLAMATALQGQEDRHEYSVKFVCGRRTAPTAVASAWDAVAPGYYYTAINLRNVGPDTATVRTQVATTRPAPSPGVLVALSSLRIPPRLALELDCREILASPHQLGGFLKGFVLLGSTAELEVVAVYSAGRGPAVETMDVERVGAWPSAPRGGVCADLTIQSVSNPLLTGNLTQLRVTVRNIGSGDASGIQVRVEDQSRTTADRIAEATISLLRAGDQTEVFLELPYQVAMANWSSLLVTVDPKLLIAECNEQNNQARLGAP
jgi:hypothetical protein